MTEPPRKGCGHGKRFDEPCRECEIIWETNCLAIFERRAAECRDRLAQLRAEQQ